MAIAVWRGRMKTRSKSDTWRWRRPTAWGLVILCALAVFEAVLVYSSFFPPFDSGDNGIFDLASLVVGTLLLICFSILLTEKTGV